ncbi:GNAT family N-acetyltransferase [Brucellaceae bacterium C25G]
MFGWPSGNLMGRLVERFSKKGFSISPLTPHDSADLEPVHMASFHEGWSAEDFRGLLSEPTVFGFSARQEGLPKKLAGFVLARLVVDEAEILTIAVDKGLRQLGAGHGLMDAVLRHLHHERAESLFLEVDQSNIAAQALYRRLGFVKVGDRPSYYQHADGTYASALILRRGLVVIK